MITYTVDANDILVDIGGDWDEFARENEGLGLTRDNVLGTPLFTFIQGAEVVTIYKALFAKARREQRPLSFTFRCDAPSCRRTMKIEIAPLTDQAIAVQTDLIESHGRDAVRLLDTGAVRTHEFLTMCCVCGDVKSANGQWVAIEEESARLRLLERTAVPQLSHAYCPKCLAEQLRLLEEPA